MEGNCEALLFPVTYYTAEMFMRFLFYSEYLSDKKFKNAFLPHVLF